MVANVSGRSAVIGRIDSHDCGQFRVFQARTDAAFDRFERQIGCYNQRKLINIAVIDDLEEFFLCPGGRILSSKVIQYQERSGSDSFKSIFKADLWIVVGEAQ